jgi:hypothetical protein
MRLLRRKFVFVCLDDRGLLLFYPRLLYLHLRVLYLHHHFYEDDEGDEFYFVNRLLYPRLLYHRLTDEEDEDEDENED